MNFFFLLFVHTILLQEIEKKAWNSVEKYVHLCIYKSLDLTILQSNSIYINIFIILDFDSLIEKFE